MNRYLLSIEIEIIFMFSDVKCDSLESFSPSSLVNVWMFFYVIHCAGKICFRSYKTASTVQSRSDQPAARGQCVALGDIWSEKNQLTLSLSNLLKLATQQFSSWIVFYEVLLLFSVHLLLHKPVSVGERSKVWVSGRSPAEIVVRIPPGAWMFVCGDECCVLQVEISATSWSLVQRIHTDCGELLCVI